MTRLISPRGALPLYNRLKNVSFPKEKQSLIYLSLNLLDNSSETSFTFFNSTS